MPVTINLAHSLTPLLQSSPHPTSLHLPRFQSSSLAKLPSYLPSRRKRFVPRISADSSQVLSLTTSPTSQKEGVVGVPSAADVVRRFYSGVNDRNLAAVVDLIAEDCVYEDLVFPKPFKGRKAILEFFDSFMNTISKDLQFAIDDISEEDTVAVGVTWHLEWKGRPFPFSKGCSLYRLDVIEGKRQIIYGRDVVEPFIKPGDAALTAIRGVTWLLERFPQLADRI